MKMVNLTPLFREAQKRQSLYGEDAALRTMKALTSLKPGSKMDWEAGEENWGLIFVDREESAFVCSVIPICFAQQRLRQDIEGVLAKNGVLGVYADDLSVDKFKIEPAIIREIFNTDPVGRVDCDNITLQEIWFVTVTA